MPRESCAQAVLEIIVSLHKNQILWRIGSHKYKRSKGIGPSSKVIQLQSGLQSIAMNLRSECRRQRKESSKVADDIDRFSRLTQDVERCDCVNGCSHLLAVVKAAEKLSSIQTPPGASDVLPRVLRQVRALANYQRISKYFASVARLYRKSFASICLDVIHLGSRERVVHAEIQILVHHSAMQDRILPRSISASKKTCFLCDRFFRAFGGFTLSKTHGQIYPKWSVPDASHFSEPLRKKLHGALQMTARDVTYVLAGLNRKSGRGQAPTQAQSVYNLQIQMPATPSALTMISEATSDAFREATLGVPQPNILHADPAHRTLEQQSCSAGSLDFRDMQNETLGKQEQYLECQWLHLYISHEPINSIQHQETPSESVVNGNVPQSWLYELRHANDSDVANPVVNVDELSETEIVLDLGRSLSHQAVQLRMVSSGRQPLQLSLSGAKCEI